MSEEESYVLLAVGENGEEKNSLEERPIAEEPQSESSVSENPAKKRKSTRRQQKYRKAWEGYSEFCQWLSPVESNVYKARCNICAKTLVADLSVLQAHSQAIVHNRNMERLYQADNLDLLEKVNPRERGRASVQTASAKLYRREATSYRKDEIDDLDIDRLSIADPEASDGGGAYESTSMTLEASHSQSASGAYGLSFGGRSKSASYEAQSVSCKAIVTKPAPPWRATAIVNGHVTRLELSDYKGRYLVLFFYPQDFSSVCPTELHALSDRIAEFRAIQTEVVACSVDSHLTHLAWSRLPRSEGGLGNPKIPLLADPTHAIARDYGVILPDLGHSLRAHFIIDRRGILRHSLVNDISVGRSIDEILRTAQALQHVDENETGCPADWKPGDPSI